MQSLAHVVGCIWVSMFQGTPGHGVLSLRLCVAGVSRTLRTLCCHHAPEVLQLNQEGYNWVLTLLASQL